MSTFASRYASLREDELQRLADDVKNLVPEARDALRAEFERRHLSVRSVDWKAHAPRPMPHQKTNLVGDAAGEYREMERGRYQAWIHVTIAFGLEAALFTLLVTKGLSALFPSISWFGVGIGCGCALAALVYADRWRCIEAYASEWCTGILNLSLLAVPFVAFAYANYRGLQKLRGK
jgi:hypothetical protein